MGLLEWLRRKLGRNNQPIESAEEEQALRESDEFATFLNHLSGELNLDANTKIYLAAFVEEAKHQIDEGRALLFGPESTADELVAEGAYQGYLDPVAQASSKSVALRDDVLIRIMIYYARHGNPRSASGVRSVADGTFKKRSKSHGADESVRIAKRYMAEQSARV